MKRGKRDKSVLLLAVYAGNGWLGAMLHYLNKL